MALSSAGNCVVVQLLLLWTSTALAQFPLVSPPQSAIAVVGEHPSPSFLGWRPEIYPDPRLNVGACRQSTSSFVCDPDGVLTGRQRFDLSRHVANLARISSDVDAASPVCRRIGVPYGIQFFVLLADTIDRRAFPGVAEQSLAKEFARRIKIEYGLARLEHLCDNAVVIVCSRLDGQFYPLAGRDTHLTPWTLQGVFRTYFDNFNRGDFYDGLMEMITDYFETFSLGEANRPQQPPTADRGSPPARRPATEVLNPDPDTPEIITRGPFPPPTTPSPPTFGRSWGGFGVQSPPPPAIIHFELPPDDGGGQFEPTSAPSSPPSSVLQTRLRTQPPPSPFFQPPPAKVEIVSGDQFTSNGRNPPFFGENSPRLSTAAPSSPSDPSGSDGGRDPIVQPTFTTRATTVQAPFRSSFPSPSSTSSSTVRSSIPGSVIPVPEGVGHPGLYTLVVAVLEMIRDQEAAAMRRGGGQQAKKALLPTPPSPLLAFHKAKSK